MFFDSFLQLDDLFSARNGKVTDPLICLCKWQVQLLIWDFGCKGNKLKLDLHDINRFLAVNITARKRKIFCVCVFSNLGKVRRKGMLITWASQAVGVNS